MHKDSISRRRFLKHTGLAAGAVTASSATSVFADTSDSKKKVGVALVGLGSYSRNKLAPALEMTKHCHLTGIVTGSPEKIPVWQKKYNIKDSNVFSYETMDKIAGNPDIDVVYIVVPTGLHAKYAIQAANAGKHVWCEKPMAMTTAECQSIIDACKENKVKLTIGYRMQHEPNTMTVIKYAKSKPYGAIKSLEADAGYRGRDHGKGWRFNPKLGGGALYDMGVYPINALRYASGMEPIRVLSAERILGKTGVELTTNFTLEFPGGVIGKGRTSVVQSYNRLRVNCANGWYELKPMSTYDGVKGRTSDGTLLDVEVRSQQALQMDSDALAILKNTPVRVPGEEGMRDIRIIEAIKEADRTGAPVDLT